MSVEGTMNNRESLAEAIDWVKKMQPPLYSDPVVYAARERLAQLEDGGIFIECRPVGWTTRSETERLARVLYIIDPVYKPPYWEDCTPDMKEWYRVKARGILHAFDRTDNLHFDVRDAH